MPDDSKGARSYKGQVIVDSMSITINFKWLLQIIAATAIVVYAFWKLESRIQKLERNKVLALEEIQATIPIVDGDWIAGGGAGSVDLANVCTISNPAVDGIGCVLQGSNWAGTSMDRWIHVVGIAGETMNVASTSDLIIKVGVEY